MARMAHYADRVHRAPIACEAAGVNEVTLRAWRRRHGFLKAELPGREWPHFSFLDICQIRLAALATDHGVRPASAIEFAQRLQQPLAAALKDWNTSSIVGFTRPSGQSGKHRMEDKLELVEPKVGRPIEDALDRADGLMVTFVDLSKVVEDVRSRLELVLGRKPIAGAHWPAVEGD